MTAPWWRREDRGPTSAELRAHVVALEHAMGWCTCGAGEHQPPERHSPPCPGAAEPEGYAR